MAKRRRLKSLSLYKKALLIYTGIIVLLIISLLVYVSLCLKEYDKYDLDNFIKNSVADLSNKDLINIIDDKKLTVNSYEKLSSKKEIVKAIDKSLEDSKNITYKLNEESKDDKKPIYDIYYNDKLVLTIKLLNKGNIQKIKLLNYTKWEVVDIKSHIEEGLYTVSANLPEDYKLFINNKEVKESVETDDKTLALFAQFTDIKKFKNYEIKGLIQKPKVVVKDADNKTVKTITKDNVITVENNYFKTDNNEEAQSKLVESFDVLSFAEKYSLFLTNDLSGYSHGFGTLSQYVIEGTDMYKIMYDWAHGIDITFTSRHTLKNPTFTNEKLSNFVIYSDKAFSVDVTLEKNMTVKGEDRVMKMNDRLSFVYYNGGWKLLSMESI
jgi:hypothetical protein